MLVVFPLLGAFLGVMEILSFTLVSVLTYTLHSVYCIAHAQGQQRERYTNGKQKARKINGEDHKNHDNLQGA